MSEFELPFTTHPEGVIEIELEEQHIGKRCKRIRVRHALFNIKRLLANAMLLGAIRLAK